MSRRFMGTEERRRRRHRTLIYVILATLPFYFCGIVLLVGFSGVGAEPDDVVVVATETPTETPVETPDLTQTNTPGGPTLTVIATLTLRATPTQMDTPTRTPTPDLDATATIRALLTQGANSLTATAVAPTQRAQATATAAVEATATARAQATATAQAGATATAAARATATANAIGTATAGANRPPNADNDQATTEQRQPVTINVLANDSDPDGDTLSIVDYARLSEEGGAVECASGACRYVPPDGFSGTDRFTYTVGDGRGGTDQAQVAVEVTASPNRPPDAQNDEATTEAGQPVTINVLANDTDPDGDTLSIVDVDDVAAEGGAVECQSQGPCVYTPPEGFTGVDTFAYTIGDGRGGQDTALVDVTVTEAD